MENYGNDEYSSKRDAFFEELIHDQKKLSYAVSSMSNVRLIELYKYIERRLDEPLDFNEGERLVDAKVFLEENDVIVDYLTTFGLSLGEINSINQTIDNLNNRRKRNKSFLYNLYKCVKG